MSDVSHLTQRIDDALSRIDRAITTPAAKPPPEQDTEALTSKLADLTALLEEERAANSQLEDRVRLLKDRQDGKLAELTSNVDAGRARATRMDRELQRLRQVNADLRDINMQLRDAVADGISEPQLVNAAMHAELEALRATRAADAAEMDAILEELTPLIAQETTDATG